MLGAHLGGRSLSVPRFDTWIVICDMHAYLHNTMLLVAAAAAAGSRKC